MRVNLSIPFTRHGDDAWKPTGPHDKVTTPDTRAKVQKEQDSSGSKSETKILMNAKTALARHKKVYQHASVTVYVPKTCLKSIRPLNTDETTFLIGNTPRYGLQRSMTEFQLHFQAATVEVEMRTCVRG